MYAWTLLEAPASPGAFAAAGGLALVPALFGDWRWRAVATLAVGATALAVTFETWPHHALRDAWDGLRDAPAVQAPFDPSNVSSLHGLVVVTAFSFALVAALGAACRRPWIVVAAVAAGVGFPAVLLEDGHALLLGALALGAALWASLVLGAAGVRRALAGLALAGALVAVSAGVAIAGISPGSGQVDWRGWDPFAGGGSGDVRFLWDASYTGIDFPIRPTVMLRIRAPARAQYWRMSTLETFTDDRWIEHLFPVSLGRARGNLPRSPLAPRRDLRPGSWLRQEVTVVGLDDTRVPAATEPALVDGASLGRVRVMQGGVMVADRQLRRGETYTVWSHAPRPTPRELAAAPARYPSAAQRYVELESALFPWYGAAGRVAQVDRIFRQDNYSRAARVPAALGGGTPAHCTNALALRGDAGARAMVPNARRLSVRGAPAPEHVEPATRRLRGGHPGRVLPALRRRNGADAADARDPGPRRRRLHRGDVEGRRLDGHRSAGARLGGGVVRRLWMARLRPDPRPRDALGRVYARVRLGGRRACARHRPVPRLHAEAADAGRSRRPGGHQSR